MGKKSTIVAVALIALLLAGIVLAITRLYKPVSGKEVTQNVAPAGWAVLNAIPSDATAVMVFDGSAKAQKILADSIGLVQGLLAQDNKALMPLLQALGTRHLAVSLHNSGSLVPLVAAEAAPSDSTLPVLAAAAGLRIKEAGGFILASRSETFLNASARHLDEGTSILSTRRLQDLVKTVSGPAVLFASHSQAPKLLQMYAGKAYQQDASFVRNLTAWSAWSVQESEKDHIVIKGSALPGESNGSYFTAFQGIAAQAPEFPDVLPYFTATVISLPIADVDAFLEGQRRFEDGNGRLVRYNKAMKARDGRPLQAEEWFRSLHPREVVRAAFRDNDGMMHQAVLVRSAQNLKLGKESKNAYRGVLASALGPEFALADSICASINSRWSIFADLPTVRLFQDPSFMEYSLKNRLSDASVTLPQGMVVYASLGDAPDVPRELLNANLGEPLQEYVRGAGFAPAVASLDLQGAQPSMRLQLDTRVLKGSKVQVMERDTTVVIPTGLFPVTNYSTGKTNYLYQNAHLSICLNDENNKGVWGIPFKEPICGRVQTIDYYNNGKLQFLFCAGDKLYLLDRLGHWVKDFPVSLGKPVLLGPDAYDFTGAGGYTITVLHKDNSLERYNLHGRKPDGWKGIYAPEKVKNLPELVETKGKRYWVVRTSVQTLIYAFDGGEPLYKAEGGKMIKPDATVMPTGKGVSVECYDGKVRDIKLN